MDGKLGTRSAVVSPSIYMLYKHATRVPTSQKDTLQACPFFKVHERSECTFDYKNERSEFL